MLRPAFTGGGGALADVDIERRGTAPGAAGGSGGPPGAGGGGAESTDMGGIDTELRADGGGAGGSFGGGGGALSANDGGGASLEGEGGASGAGAAGDPFGLSLNTGILSGAGSSAAGAGGAGKGSGRGGGRNGSGAISAALAAGSSARVRRGFRRRRLVASPGSCAAGGGEGGASGGDGASPPDGGRGFSRSGCGSSLMEGQVNDLTTKHETKKIHSRSHRATPKLPQLPMKRLVPFALAAVLLTSSACHMFSSKKNPSAPKESKTVAVDVEKDFMHRWIDKRAADLVSQGRAPDAARAQAVSEFKATFSYTTVAAQAK